MAHPTGLTPCVICGTLPHLFYEGQCPRCMSVPIPKAMPPLWRVCHAYSSKYGIQMDPRLFEARLLMEYGRMSRSGYVSNPDPDLEARLHELL